jgi:hypothetical protein
MLIGTIAAGCGQPASEPGSGPERAALAGASTEEDPVGNGPGGGPGGDADAQIDPGPSGAQTPVGGRPWDRDASDVCVSRLGAAWTQVAQSVDEAGTTTFWTAEGGAEAPEEWALCDVVDGSALVLRPSPGAGPGFDERSLGVATAPLEADGGALRGRRVVAGGPLPWRVDELTYRFPDGQESSARFVASADAPDQVWWVVTHTPTSGVLVEHADAEGAVLVSVVGAAAEAFRFRWSELQRRR